MTRDDGDLHAMFHAAAPPVRPVDVEGLFAAAGRRAGSTETSRSPWKRSVSMSLRITAGVLVAASLAGVATLLVPRQSTAKMTLAEVQATVEKTQTMTCKCFHQKVPPAKQKDEPDRILIRGPNIVRFEQADGSYTVTDFARHKSLLVDPAKKSARVLEGFTPPGGVQIQSFYDLFRSIASRPVKTLPPRLIGGKMCVGFVVRNPMEGAPGLPKSPEAETTVWVNPETKLPLRIETVTREDGVTLTEIMSGIVFDRPLDPALFVLTPPEGYKVETFGVAELRPEPAAKGKDKAVTEVVATPLVGLGEVKFGMKADDVIRLLGKPDKTFSPNKDYTLLEYYSRGFSIHTTTQARCDDDHVLHRKILGLQGPRLRRADGQGDQDRRHPRRHREGLRQAELGPRGDVQGYVRRSDRQARQEDGPGGPDIQRPAAVVLAARRRARLDHDQRPAAGGRRQGEAREEVGQSRMPCEHRTAGTRHGRDLGPSVGQETEPGTSHCVLTCITPCSIPKPQIFSLFLYLSGCTGFAIS